MNVQADHSKRLFLIPDCQLSLLPLHSLKMQNFIFKVIVKIRVVDVNHQQGMSDASITVASQPVVFRGDRIALARCGERVQSDLP